MELINEINTIKNLMNLNVLNEAAAPWIDEVWTAVKSIFTNFRLSKSSVENFIIKGFDENQFKTLKKSILASPNGQLGVDLKTALTTAKNNLPVTSTADRLLIDTRIRQIDNLIKSIADKKLIKTTIDSLESSYPTLFKKKWYGSYVNQARIDSIQKQLTRDLKGKSAKDIEDIIEKKLSDAESKLSKIKNPKKNTYQKLLKRYREYMIKNPGIGSLKTFGFGTIVYLFYHLISNTIETGSPISGGMKTGSDIWGDIKKGWYSSKSYPNTPNGLLTYLTEKYGANDYQNNFKLTRAGDIVTITPINGGETKSFQHNGKTFIEL